MAISSISAIINDDIHKVWDIVFAVDKYSMILSILVYTFFSRIVDLVLPHVAKHSIVVA